MQTAPIIAALATVIAFVACGGDNDTPTTATRATTPAAGATTPAGSVAADFFLGSEAFDNDGDIPPGFTCDGADVSPALGWRNAPPVAQSFALIMDDPDAPGGTFSHWVIYNMSADATDLPEGVEKTERPTNGAGGLQGMNDSGELGYAGPCPPQGPAHRYVFQLYALDGILELEPGASKEDLLTAMEGHIISKAQFTGTYERQ